MNPYTEPAETVSVLPKVERCQRCERGVRRVRIITEVTVFLDAKADRKGTFIFGGDNDYVFEDLTPFGPDERYRRHRCAVRLLPYLPLESLDV